MGLSVDNPDALEIGIPTSPGQIVSMTHPVPIYRAFVADFAACHEGNLPYEIEAKYNTRHCWQMASKSGDEGDEGGQGVRPWYRSINPPE